MGDSKKRSERFRGKIRDPSDMASTPFCQRFAADLKDFGDGLCSIFCGESAEVRIATTFRSQFTKTSRGEADDEPLKNLAGEIGFPAGFVSVKQSRTNRI